MDNPRNILTLATAYRIFMLELVYCNINTFCIVFKPFHPVHMMYSDRWCNFNSKVIHWNSPKRGFHVYYTFSNFSNFIPNTCTQNTQFSMLFFQNWEERKICNWCGEICTHKLCVIGVSGKSKNCLMGIWWFFFNFCSQKYQIIMKKWLLTWFLLV